jgi:hypothetical protein
MCCWVCYQKGAWKYLEVGFDSVPKRVLYFLVVRPVLDNLNLKKVWFWFVESRYVCWVSDWHRKKERKYDWSRLYEGLIEDHWVWFRIPPPFLLVRYLTESPKWHSQSPILFLILCCTLHHHPLGLSHSPAFEIWATLPNKPDTRILNLLTTLTNARKCSSKKKNPYYRPEYNAGECRVGHLCSDTAL